MASWREWLHSGDQYKKAAGGQKNKAARFNTEHQYNVIAIALESYVMAILDFHKKLPDNHTFTDFVEALDKVTPLSKSLRERILQHEQIQKLCSFTDYTRTEASQEQINDFRDAVSEIGDIAHSVCIE